MASIFSGIANLFHHSSGPPELPPGNSQWERLANFFPEDDKVAKDFKGGQRLNVGDALVGLGAFAASQATPPPQPPPQPQWLAPPQPQFRDLLSGAPRLPQRTMPTPNWMQPYMWGGR